MANHMDRLIALGNIKSYIDDNTSLPDNEEVLPGVVMKDLRDIVMPTTAEDVR